MHNITSPRTDDEAMERLIQAKGLTAPRITPTDVEQNIVGEHYFTAGDGVLFALQNDGAKLPGDDALTRLGLLTFCVLILRNGFTVTGESACASPENFDADIGRSIARENAVQKVWPFMGYALCNTLAAG